MSDRSLKETEEGLTESQKWFISLWIAVLFLVVSNKPIYRLTNSVTTSLFGPNASTVQQVETTSGKSLTLFPTYFGIFLHALVLAVLVRLVMFIPFPK